MRIAAYSFWISLAVIAYTYAGYPLFIYLLARFRPRPWQHVERVRSLSVIMAVHNGAALLHDQLEHLGSLDGAYVREVIVISDGSTDGTVDILKEVSDPRFRVIILKDQVGKAMALNHGLAIATSEILLFVDIRPRVQQGAIAKLISNFVDPTVGCVAGELLLRSQGQDGATSAVSGFYWRYEQWIRNCEAAIDSPVGVYGGFYAVRRELVTKFPSGIILDDMFQPLSIIRQGYRSVLDRTAFVIDAWPANMGGEFQRKVRTLAGNFQLIAVAPWALSVKNRVWLQLVSHKLLRLALPYLFLVALVSATVLGVNSIGWRALAELEWGFWGVSLLGLKVKIPFIHRYAAIGGALLALNAAAVMGLYKFIFTSGPLWRIWSVSTPHASGAITFETKRERA